MRGSGFSWWRRSARALVVMAVAGLVVAIGPAVSSADGPHIWVTDPTAVPGTVTVEGSGWSGGVWLYQCADMPNNDDEFWSACDPSTGIQVTVIQVTEDPQWPQSFTVLAIVDTPAQDPFPDGTVNWMGNGTQDCEAAGAHCGILAVEGSTYRWADLDFTEKYGPVTVEVRETTTELTDGAEVTVTSFGHRPGTQAMTYLCIRDGPAYPGGCDPVVDSLGTAVGPADGVGTYSELVSLPRFVWNNDPFGNADWFDCADGCSLTVFSADNLGSPNGGPVTFFAVDVEQHPQLLTVEKVFVNRFGGITVEGLLNCSVAMEAWGQGGFPAGVNVNWTARQPVGKRSAVTASYRSAMQSMCHWPPRTGPFRWVTMPPITTPDPEIWWVFPESGGKFTSGAIHVDVQVTGAPWGGWGSENYILTGVRQWDGKAVRK